MVIGGQEALLPEPLPVRWLLKRCSVHPFRRCDAACPPDTQMDREKGQVKSTNGTRCWVRIPEQRLREEQARGATAENSIRLCSLASELSVSSWCHL